MARPLPDHLLGQRLLKRQQIRQKRAVRCPANKWPEQIPQRITAKMSQIYLH